MTLAGTRPPTLDEWNKYELHHRARLAMIRWLHISDLHIKDRADWNNFERELLEKCKEFGKINIIIVTGDFHNFCEKENFILAKEFLVRLTEQLELDINKDLFIVPGNHDGVTKVDCKNTHGKYVYAL